MTYQPKGKIVPLIQAMQADPERIWTVPDAMKIIGGKANKVGNSLTYAMNAGMVFRGKYNGRTAYRAMPFPEESAIAPPKKQIKHERRETADGWATRQDDPRIPRIVPGWVPPAMVCHRVIDRERHA